MLLKQGGADIGLCDSLGRSAIHWSCRQSNTKCLVLLLKHIPSSAAADVINRQDKTEGLTAMHWAVANIFPGHLR